MHIFLVDHIDLAGIPCPTIALTFEVDEFTDEMEAAFKDDYEIIKVSTLEVLVYEQIKQQTGSPFVPWDIFESGRKAFTKDFAKELAQELTR